MSYLDLLVDIDGFLTLKLFDKRDYFNFPIVKFPHLDSNIPVKPAYGVYVSQLIWFFHDCTYYSDFLYRHQLLEQKLVSHRYHKKVLKHSFFKFCCNNNVADTTIKTRHIMVKEGIYHNFVNYTASPNSSMTNDLPVYSSVITPMSTVVCTPVSPGIYQCSRGVSAPMLSSVIKPESSCVPMPVSPGVSSLHSSAMGCVLSDHHNHILIQQSHANTSVSQVPDGLDWKPIGLQNLGNKCYLNSVLQYFLTIDYYTSFLPANTTSPLMKILNEFRENKSLKM